MKIKLSIYRYNQSKKAKPQFQKYEIPYRKGMTLLDALQFIHQNIDPTLAFRYECRMSICGTCGVMLNEKPVLSCSTQIDYTVRENIITPLSNFPVEKDLIVNLVPILKRLKKIKPYLERIKKVRITKSKANESKPFRKCIECGCCIACHSTKKNGEKQILDPMALVKLARYSTDPRDGLDRKSIAKKAGAGKYTIEEGRKLASVCPREIPINEAILLLKNP